MEVEIDSELILSRNIVRLEETIRLEQEAGKNIKDQYSKLLHVLDGKVRREIYEHCFIR